MLPGQWLKAQGARKCGTVHNSVPCTGRHSTNISYLLTLPVSESDKCVITKHDLSRDHCSWALLGGLAGQEDPSEEAALKQMHAGWRWHVLQAEAEAGEDGRVPGQFGGEDHL